MSEAMTGGCRCGQLRYEVRPSFRMNGYACHCTDCQTRTGSAFALQQPVFLNDVTLTGERLTGTHTQPGAPEVTLTACARCLVPVMTENCARPGMAVIRAGTLDDSQAFTPAFHIWTRSRQPWVVVSDGVPALAESPAGPAEWQSLLTAR